MFKIGEFSKIARVSGRLLRYYDEIGLLQPIEIDEFTGYRSYSATQLPRLNRILALKDLGLSLDQIRRMLDDDISPDEMRGMLLMRQAQVEQTVSDEMARIRQIEVRLAQLEGQIPEADVVLKSAPIQHYLAVDFCCPRFEHGFALLQEMVSLVPQQVGQENLGTPMVIFRAERYETEDFDLSMGYLLQNGPLAALTLPSGHKLSTRTLPAVATMATVTSMGASAENHLSYNRLGQWIEANGYQLAGDGRELFLQMPRPGAAEEAVMEIQLPLQKIEGNN